MLVTISKRANKERVPKKYEFVREYLSLERLAALDMIDDAIYRYRNFTRGKIYPEKVEELKALENLQVGDYEINVGNYTYYITIEGEE